MAVLVEESDGRLRALAGRYLSDGADVEDVMQAALVRACTRLESFEGRSRLSTWLCRILINEALMLLRARRREQRGLEGLALKSASSVEERERDGEAALDLETDETRALILSGIDQLPPTYQAVVRMRDLEGRGTAETARRLRITKAAVKVRLHRGHRALRSILDRHRASGAL